MPVVNIRQVNGVVRTSEPVWSNLERLAEACTSWFTYDVHTGLYSWVINEAGNSTASLSEADIIGPIQISGSGLNNLYNSIEIEYPNTDIRDQPHYVRLELPSDLRNAYEPDNTLQITSEFINNQPQAEYSAMVNLKQSRLDRTITINMDYTKINIRAGDIIDVTSPTYGWSNKEFRVMRVREIEGDDGSLRLEFSCSEYDDTIYDGTWAEFLVGGAPGIISIGSIGKPGTPTIETVTVDSLPAQAVTTTIPTGIVDRMQFWAGNVTITGNVNNTAFDLYGTVASTDAASFTTGANVTFTTTSLRDGDWVWKTRGLNVNGVGQFSDLSGNVQYTRLQAPDVIKIGTPLVNANGEITVSTQTMGQFAFVNFPADAMYFTGNAQYKGLIYTSDAYMAGIGTKVANIGNIVAPATKASMTVNLSSTATTDFRGVLTPHAGTAIYYSIAPWNGNTYANSGFAGLSWSSWNLIGLSLDSIDSLGGNVRFSTSTDTAINLEGKEGNVIAFGISSTLIPTAWANIVPTIDPDSGVPKINYTKGFSGNTVIFDAGPNTYQTPGITAANTLLGGQVDSWLNYRFIP